MCNPEHERSAVGVIGSKVVLPAWSYVERGRPRAGNRRQLVGRVVVRVWLSASVPAFDCEKLPQLPVASNPQFSWRTIVPDIVPDADSEPRLDWYKRFTPS